MESLEDFAREFDRLSRLLDGAHRLVREQIYALAEAEAEYRKAKAEAWVECPPADRAEWTAARREAWVDRETAEQRRKRDIADGMRHAGLEAVKSRRTQISALQSLLAARREEVAFDRTVPRGA